MIELAGIDGTNPLGFVAALGVVAVTGGRVSWTENGGKWTPILSDTHDRAALVDLLHARLSVMPYAYTLGAAATIEYEDFKEPEPESEPKPKQPKKPPKKKPKKEPTVKRMVTEAVFRAALEQCADDPAEMERLAAHTCATALREGVKVRMTAVRSVSGQGRYLTTLRAIVTKCKREDIDRALFGTWRYAASPKLSLDPHTFTENIPCNISTLGSLSEIGAERLALEGLRGLPTSIHRGTLVTRGYREGAFRWTLSARPRSFHGSSGLLGDQMMFDEDVARWATAIGVGAVYESPVESYGQGYRILRPSIRVWCRAPQCATV